MTKKQSLTNKEKVQQLKNRIAVLQRKDNAIARKERTKLLINLGLMTLQKSGKKLDELKPSILDFIKKEKEKAKNNTANPQ